MAERPRTITFIGWESDSSRLVALALAFDAPVHLFFVPRRKRSSASLIQRCVGLGHVGYRYVRQGSSTVVTLLRERPDVVLVQNPPIVLALLASVYAMLPGRGFVIDSHTGAFSDWGWSLRLHRWLSRRSMVTLVHNHELAEAIEEWDVRTLVLGFVDGAFPQPVRPDFFNSSRQSITVVCRHTAGDEPLREIYTAAASLPEVDFYVTGDANRLDDRLREQRPDNCLLTGFLAYEQFIGLLSDSDAVMSLTTREDTLQSGGIEAVSLGRVLITSDTKTLRSAFSSGAVFVENTGPGIAEGVRQALANRASLRTEAVAHHQVLMNQWRSATGELARLLNVDCHGLSPLLDGLDERSNRDA